MMNAITPRATAAGAKNTYINPPGKFKFGNLSFLVLPTEETGCSQPTPAIVKQLAFHKSLMKLGNQPPKTASGANFCDFLENPQWEHAGNRHACAKRLPTRMAKVFPHRKTL